MEIPEFEEEEDRQPPSNCGICGESHLYHNCNYVAFTRKINNKEIPSRAKLSLPDTLQINKLADETYSVFTKTTVEVGTEFGPFVAKKTLTLNPFITFPIKIFTRNESDLSEYYLDTMDENECCWMMFVNAASEVDEQNLICFQGETDIFFRCIKQINPGEQLKVWYAPYYASKMHKNTLYPEEDPIESTPDETNKPLDLNTLVKEQQKIIPRLVWNCKFCYKLETNVTDFARHLQTHYNLRKGKMCEYCQHTFRYTNDYKRHLKQNHSEQLDNDTTSEKSAKPQQILLNYDDPTTKQTQIDIVSSTIGGPLLLQSFSDSLDNSNSLMPPSEVNYFDIDNYDNLLDNEHLHLNVDIIGNHCDKDLESIKSKETNKKEILCDICLKKFQTFKAISAHLKMHMGNYFCSTCKKVFSRPENLKQHECNRIYQFKCPKCEKIFYQKKYLAKHMSVVHDKKFTCPSCRKYYHSARELQNHICQKASKEGRPKFTCHICLKQLAKEEYLQKHLKMHSNNTEKTHYICSECSVSFSSQITYKRHLISVHLKSKEFSCHICDKQFARRDMLKSHLMNIHVLLGQQGVHKCSKCNKQFKSKKTLDAHVKTTHSTSKYKCHCGATFKYSRNLVRHFNQLHKNNTNITTEELHECPVCKVKVKLKRSLQRHIRQKHPEKYKDMCLQMQAQKEEKKNIQRCPICSESIKSLASLDKHISRKHSNEFTLIPGEFVTKSNKKEKDTIDAVYKNYTECMDLQKTIENMDFNLDPMNANQYGGSETIDNFLRESSEQISIIFGHSPRIMNVNDNPENRQRDLPLLD